MKTAIVAMLLATAIASPSIAQTLNGQSCPQCVARPEPIPFVRPDLGWNPAWSKESVPNYVSRSTMTINHSNGTTSTINSTYRSYSHRSYSR